jgi:hypothetical protein
MNRGPRVDTERLHPSTRRARAASSERAKRRSGVRRTQIRFVFAVLAGVAALTAVAVTLPATRHAASPLAQLRTDTVSLAATAPDVVGHPWLERRGDGGWEWGEAGVAGRHQVPIGEHGVAVGGAWLVTDLPSGTTTRVIVRDRHSGGTVLETDVPFWVSTGSIAGNSLLLAGYGDRTMSSDGGLVAIELRSGSMRVLVPSGRFADRVGILALHGDITVSASGNTAAISCGNAGCDTTVVDLTTGAVFTPQQGQPGYLRAVTDDMVVVTGDDGAFIRGIDIRSGNVRFTIADTSLMEPVPMIDGSIVANFGLGPSGWVVGVLDSNGKRTDLSTPAAERWPWVWSPVSTGTTAILGDVTFEEALGTQTDVSAKLIRVPGLADVGKAIVVVGTERGFSMQRLAGPLALVAALALALPNVVSANEPVSGHDDRYPHATNGPQITLEFHYASSSYPAWMRSAVTASLGSGWSDNPDVPAGATEPPRQNSRAPKMTAGDGGTIYWRDVGGRRAAATPVGSAATRTRPTARPVGRSTSVSCRRTRRRRGCGTSATTRAATCTRTTGTARVCACPSSASRPTRLSTTS